jgi:hypothetical protein
MLMKEKRKTRDSCIQKEKLRQAKVELALEQTSGTFQWKTNKHIKKKRKKCVSLLNGIQQARSCLFQIPASGLERLDTHGLGAQSQSGRK